MSERLSEDLISAYLDEETSADERVQAERLLAESDDTRRELDEYRQISELVRSLPQEQASDEFRARVMHAAERETLLPSEEPRVRAPDAHSKWKKRLVPAAMTTVLAASVLFAVSHFNFGIRKTEVAVTESASPSEETAVDAYESGVPILSAVADAEVDEAAKVGEPMSGPEPKQAVAVLTESKSAAEMSDKDSGEVSPVDSYAKASRPASSERWSLRFDECKLGDAEVGEVVEALATSQDQVAVVRLTVVDRQKGLESLQVLLARNRIFPETDELSEEAGRVSGGTGEGESQESESDRLVAVYVESTPKQLSSALLELQREGQFCDLEIETPIQVASLDPLAQSQISRKTMAENGRAYGGRSEALAAKEAPKSRAASALAEAPMKRSKKSRRRLASGSVSSDSIAPSLSAVASRPEPDVDSLEKESVSAEPEPASSTLGIHSEAVAGGVAKPAAPMAPAMQESLAETKQMTAMKRKAAPQLSQSAKDADKRQQPADGPAGRSARQLALSVRSDVLSRSTDESLMKREKGSFYSLGTNARGIAGKLDSRENTGVVQAPSESGQKLLERSLAHAAAKGSLQVLFVLVSNGAASGPMSAPAKPTQPANAPATQPPPDDGAG